MGPLHACWPERLVVSVIPPSYLSCGGLRRRSTSCTGQQSSGLLNHGPLCHGGSLGQRWEKWDAGWPRWADVVPMLPAATHAVQLPPSHELLSGSAVLLRAVQCQGT